MLAALFGFCYLIAAMGNHRKYSRHHENDFGCAVIIFVAIIVGSGWYTIFGKDSGMAALVAVFLIVAIIGSYVAWKEDKNKKDK